MDDATYLQNLRSTADAPPNPWPWRIREIWSHAWGWIVLATVIGIGFAGPAYVVARLVPERDWRSEPSAFVLGLVGGFGLFCLLLVVVLAFDARTIYQNFRRSLRAMRLASTGRDKEWRRACRRLKELENHVPEDPRKVEIDNIVSQFLQLRGSNATAVLGIDLAACHRALEPLAAELGVTVEALLERTLMSDSVCRSWDSLDDD